MRHSWFQANWRSLVPLAISMMLGCSPAQSQAPAANASNPERIVKLVFIHHSCGENWLADSNGGLGIALSKRNFFVSDTNYGWGPNGIGDRTDITDWPEWFTSQRGGDSLRALYTESGQHCEYTRTATDPGGENEIVLFKSCFPNSNLEGRPTDGPVRGEGLSVANAKAIYNELLTYFATRKDKLFVVITAPPVQDTTYAVNARALNKWLVQDWLAHYDGDNVAVFDFYNVLTAAGNHHRVRGGQIEYICNQGGDTLHYPSDGDDHPSAEGNRKATKEFVPLLRAYYEKWSRTKPQDVAASAQRKEATADEMATEAVARTESSSAARTAAAASVRGEVVDDFEREESAWQTFHDGAQETRLTLTRDTQQKHGGNAALRVQYVLPAEGWATCSLVHEHPKDWSGFRGISLFVHAEEPGQPITIVVYGGKSSDELLHFEHQFKAGPEAVAQWQRIDIPWSQFQPASWQGDSSTKYDPRSAMGVALGFASPQNRGSSGQLWIDDVSLLGASD